MPQLIAALSHHRQILLAAPPGTGKSTVLPLEILRQSQMQGLIVMLEPRRLAARHIAAFLAQQLGESLGETVGYQMRGDSKRSAKTRLLIVTEGILTRMLQDDPMLESVSLVIFDEFHERSLAADLGLALCQQSLEVNEELKLLVMSATLDISALQQTLPQATVLTSEGRSFPVSVTYQPVPSQIPLDKHCARVVEQQINEHSGNILVFLPGVAEIHRVRAQLRVPSGVDVYGLYGQLPLEEQRAAIAPPTDGHRKIVLATNIAETSLTIDGIRIVVDSGLERVAQYHPGSGATRLMTRMVCQSSAEQRAGRAGRLESGECVRLYSGEQLSHRPRFNDPQILRSDLNALLMQLKQWGVESNDLNWVDAPPQGILASSEQLLRQLGLVDEHGQLTPAARQVSQWGCEPRSGALLLKARELQAQGCADAIKRGAYLAALLEEALPRSETGQLNDALIHLNAFQKKRLKQQMRRYLSQLGESGGIERPEHPLDGLLLAAAWPDRIGMRRSDHRHYLLANGFAVQAKRADSEWIVAIDIGWRQGHASGQLYLFTPLSLDMLQQFYPNWFGWQSVCEFDNQKQQFISERQQKLGELTLARQKNEQRDGQALQQGWLNVIRQRGMAWLPVSDKAAHFRQRVQALATWCPELSLPDLSDKALLATLEQWLIPYLDGVSGYKALDCLDWLNIIQSQLDWSQISQVNELAPVTYRAPSGRNVVIHYQAGQSPRMSLKLQEMFGTPQSPTIAKGRVPLTIELLSPAGRVLQLTQDLASFWQNGYPQVRKEMRGRYSKHPWPEDPTTSIATAKTKRYLRGG
ncbi:MAG: ATP-dependent RNA helicase HrpB [Candidatus Celerinatantimonas neptuna]|nr:MAG: ATP-dependent RNA helicase HrpB [Candidatus Celerinatantimonas neptuna]